MGKLGGPAKETLKRWTFDDRSRSNDDSRSRYKNRAVITEIGATGTAKYLLSARTDKSAPTTGKWTNRRRPTRHRRERSGSRQLFMLVESYKSQWKAEEWSVPSASVSSVFVPSALISPALAVDACNPKPRCSFLLYPLRMSMTRSIINPVQVDMCVCATCVKP